MVCALRGKECDVGKRSSSLSTLRAKLEASLRSFQAGAVYCWGYSPTRPDDETFIVRRVIVDEVRGRIDVEFAVEAATGLTVLSIWRPEEVVVAPTHVDVVRAARVRWGELDLVARPEGVDLREGADSRVLDLSEPAVSFQASQVFRPVES